MKIGTNVLRERAQLKCTCTCRRNDFMRFFFMGMPQAKAGTTALREPLRSKCAWTCQNNNFTIFYIILRENFVAKCGKPRRGQTFCASFFRRNAHGHVTRTISSKHTAHPKQEQMRGKLQPAHSNRENYFMRKFWNTMRQIKFPGQTLSANPRVRHMGTAKETIACRNVQKKLSPYRKQFDRLLQQDPAHMP